MQAKVNELKLLPNAKSPNIELIQSLHLLICHANCYETFICIVYNTNLLIGIYTYFIEYNTYSIYRYFTHI